MASLHIQRSLLPSDRTHGIITDLVGTGTAWTSSTTFTLSGVAGCSILTKVINSATSARLVIATGSATGTLTISDGAESATVAVAAFRKPRWPALSRRHR